MGPIPTHLLARLDGSAADSAQVLWTNVANGTGTTITASGPATPAPFSTGLYKTLGLYVAVVGSVSGTTPTLTVTVQGIDPNGNLYTLGSTASLNAAGSAAPVGIGPGQTLSTIVIPTNAQVIWVAGGTTPSFGNTQIYVIGR